MKSLGMVVTVVLLLMIVGERCTSHDHQGESKNAAPEGAERQTQLGETSAVSTPDPAQVPLASGKPVIDYSVVRGKGALSDSIFVIPKRRPQDQELVDLSYDLRAKYPEVSSFEILDAVSSIEKVRAYYEGDERVSDDFMSKHDFASFASGPSGPWRLDSLYQNPRRIAVFPLSSVDIARWKQIIARGIAVQQSDLIEKAKCKGLKDKAISELSTNDVTKLRECRVEGW